MATRQHVKPIQRKRKSAAVIKKAVRKPRMLSLEASASQPSVAIIREGLGLNRKLFARLTGYSERAIAAWEGGAELSDASLQKMIETQRLQQALSSVMKSEFIPVWLQTPISAFGGLKPLEIVERGEVDRIWRMVYALESGAPG
jgi:DNA-binding transcriptional regulator YiaG